MIEQTEEQEDARGNDWTNDKKTDTGEKEGIIPGDHDIIAEKYSNDYDFYRYENTYDNDFESSYRYGANRNSTNRNGTIANKNGTKGANASKNAKKGGSGFGVAKDKKADAKEATPAGAMPRMA